MKYLPPNVIDELEDIKRENSLNRDVEAFHEMTKYSKVGREVERIMRFGIPKPSYPKKKKNNGGF